jgi:hypothetical protein
LLGTQTLVVLGLTTVFVLGYSAQVGSDIGVYLASISDYVSYVLSLFPAAIAFGIYIAIAMIAGLAAMAVLFGPAIILYHLLKRWPKRAAAFAGVAVVGALAVSAIVVGDVDLGFWRYRGPLAGIEAQWTFAVLRPIVVSLGYDAQSLADLEYHWPYPLETPPAQIVLSILVFVSGAIGIAGGARQASSGLTEEGDAARSAGTSSAKRPNPWWPAASLLALIFCISLYSAGMMKARLDMERRFPITMHFTADSGLGTVTARPMFSTERGMIVATDDAITFYRWDQIRMVERAR